jgi:hypothetical protein
MTYVRFSQLWNALVVNRPKPADAPPISNGMTEFTATALIEYGQGNKATVNEVRKRLGKPVVN